MRYFSTPFEVEQQWELTFERAREEFQCRESGGSWGGRPLYMWTALYIQEGGALLRSQSLIRLPSYVNVIIERFYHAAMPYSRLYLKLTSIWH